MSTHAELAARVKERCYLTGSFTLRSGIVSNEYFDKYQFESDPELLHQIATELCKLIPPETEVLAGLEVGGIPVATVMAQICRLPVCFVRKEAKKYGTAKLAEGVSIEGKNVLIIEDVVTSGGQVILSTKDLRDRGARVAQALCVIDREQGGKEKLAAAGIALQSLLLKSDMS
ncbi:MAG: orotate phosphoribosyltransferase [Bacteroidota bacterium]